MTIFRYGLLVAASLLSAATAHAQSTIVLRLADYLPVSHKIREHLTKPYMAAVTKATNGKVTFQDFPSEQLGKAQDMLTLTLNGVADIGYVVPILASDKLPLAGVGDLPGSFTTSCQGASAYLKLIKSGGFLEKAEFTPIGLKVLAVAFLPPYQLMISSNNPISGISDISGLKLRTASGSLDSSVRKLGAVPIRMAAPAIHESLARGTIDGVLLPYQSTISYGLQKMIKVGSLGENFGTSVATYAISLNRWKQLPADVQQALESEGEKITRSACEDFAKEEVKSQEEVKSSGAKFITFNAADKKRISEAVSIARDEWKAALDGRGKAGSEALKAFDDAL